MRKLAIVGSRDYPDLQAVRDFVARLKPTTVVVSGGARGVDTAAIEAARERGLATEVYPADWQRWGRSAGFRRNQDIVRAADGLVAFTTGSRGTALSIKLAQRKGIWLRVFKSSQSMASAR